VKTGVQCLFNYLKYLDTGFRRYDDFEAFATFYEFVNIIQCYSLVHIVSHSEEIHHDYDKRRRDGVAEALYKE
jgi:hypothetical protein